MCTHLLGAAEDQHRVVVVQGSLGESCARRGVVALPAFAAVDPVHNVAINVQQLIADQQPFVKSNGSAASIQQSKSSPLQYGVDRKNIVLQEHAIQQCECCKAYSAHLELVRSCTPLMQQCAEEDARQADQRMM